MKARADLIDMAGQRVGSLTVVEFARTPSGRAGWRCACDCGGETVVAGNNLRRAGGPVSCAACVARDRRARKLSHGHVGTPEYGIYMTMKSRCQNRASKKYRNYGAAGIRCLFRDFAHFLAVIGPRPSAKHSVDRIDVFGDYAPGNVRWATMSEQQRNKRPRRPAFSLTREDFLGLARAPLSFGA